jgi:enoyl-CoA hydratase
MHATTDIVFERRGRSGHITLNRPKALNALTLPMIRAMDPQLRTWAKDTAIQTIVLTGTGEKAFCAGGDVRAVYEAGKGVNGADKSLTHDFFFEEYRLNRLIHRYAKPYVSLIDGICMGGGMGLSVNGRIRVVTERAMMAMPETGIGLFPDVGGSHFLSRCPGQLGVYLALIGARLKAADMIYAGLATHYVPSAKLPELQSALESEAADTAVMRFAEKAGDAPLAGERVRIDRCFAAEMVEQILEALGADGSEWARKTSATLLTKSPLSMKVALRQVRTGAKLDFEECMRMEFRLVQRFMKDHDFFEGIRAVLVDKENAPKWQPATLAGVTPAMVDAYFAPLPEGELTFVD